MTPFDTDKAAVLAVISPVNCEMASTVNRLAIDYTSLFDALLSYAKTFDCDSDDLLNPIMEALADSTRTANGIYYQKTNVTITNPRWVIRSVTVTININGGGTPDELAIYNTTAAINITGNTKLYSLTLGKGSTVSLLSIDAGSSLKSVTGYACDLGTTPSTYSFQSTLTKATYGSKIEEAFFEPGATFGGYTCAPLTQSNNNGS